MSSPIDEALPELNARLEQQGIRARIWMHDGMTAVMIHRDGDTAATVDGALDEGPERVGELANEIARERDLPVDWLSLAGFEPPAFASRVWLSSCVVSSF